MAAEGPLLHRRRLGAELRRLRGDRTLDEVADATLISTSKLSRLENGQGVPNQRDIRDLVAFYGLDTAAAERLRRWASAGRSQAWWRDYSDTLTSGYDTYLDYESGASTIRIFAAAMVPALLQTTAYTRVLQAAIPPAKSADDVRRMIEVKERRADMLIRSADAPRLIVVIDEAALRRPVGSAADMAAQLDHLLEVSRRRNVSLTVLPFGAGAHAGLQGQFTVLQYADALDRDVVAVESHTGDRFHEQPTSVLEYLRIFDAISAKALDHDESRAFIADVHRSLPAQEDRP